MIRWRTPNASKTVKIKVVRNWTPHTLLLLLFLLLFSHLTPQPAATSRYPTAEGLIFSFMPSFRMLFILTPDILLKPFQHCLSFALNWLKPGRHLLASKTSALFAICLAQRSKLAHDAPCCPSHTFSLTATDKIGPDTNSLTFVPTAARFWP